MILLLSNILCLVIDKFIQLRVQVLYMSVKNLLFCYLNNFFFFCFVLCYFTHNFIFREIMFLYFSFFVLKILFLIFCYLQNKLPSNNSIKLKLVPLYFQISLFSNIIKKLSGWRNKNVKLKKKS